MPMFWAEFFADTERVSDDARKAYLMLLGHAWLMGAKVPDDDRVLARLAGVSGKKWSFLKDEVLSFWTKREDGYWGQKRLQREWDFCCQKREDNRKNGSLGGKRRAEKTLIDSTDDPKRMGKQPTPTPTQELEPYGSCPQAPQEAQADLLGDPVKTEKKKDPINGHATQIVDQFVVGWDAIGISRCRAISKTRQGHILARARDLVEAFNFPDPAAGFAELFARIRGSPFLLGHTGRWKCDLDWVVTESNFLKIMEGKYAPEQKPKSFLAEQRPTWTGNRH